MMVVSGVFSSCEAMDKNSSRAMIASSAASLASRSDWIIFLKTCSFSFMRALFFRKMPSKKPTEEKMMAIRIKVRVSEEARISINFKLNDYSRFLFGWLN